MFCHRACITGFNEASCARPTKPAWCKAVHLLIRCSGPPLDSAMMLAIKAPAESGDILHNAFDGLCSCYQSAWHTIKCTAEFLLQKTRQGWQQRCSPRSHWICGRNGIEGSLLTTERMCRDQAWLPMSLHRAPQLRRLQPSQHPSPTPPLQQALLLRLNSGMPEAFALPSSMLHLLGRVLLSALGRLSKRGCKLFKPSHATLQKKAEPIIHIVNESYASTCKFCCLLATLVHLNGSVKSMEAGQH